MSHRTKLELTTLIFSLVVGFAGIVAWYSGYPVFTMAAIFVCILGITLSDNDWS